MAHLQGSKCQAPFDNEYDETSTYHNALIMSVKMNDSTNQHSLDDIMVQLEFFYFLLSWKLFFYLYEYYILLGYCVVHQSNM